MIDLSKHKLKLEYPCNWSYKLVVLESTNIKAVIKEIILERTHRVTESNVSKKGKFKSYNLDLIVHNDDDRTTLHEMLGKHSEIKMVL